MPNTVPAADAGLPTDNARRRRGPRRIRRHQRRKSSSVTSSTRSTPPWSITAPAAVPRSLTACSRWSQSRATSASSFRVDVAAIFQPKEMKPWMR